MSLNLKCPVCGNINKQSSVSEYDCGVCGFNNAFVRYFATSRGYELWKSAAEKAQFEWQNEKKKRIFSSIKFWIGNNLIAFADNDSITIIHGNGTVAIERNARELSECERNYAVLYENGTVKVFGDDNIFGQKNTDKWRDIKFVLSAPNCTYGVTKSGEIVYSGSVCSHEISNWQNIKLLRSGNDFLVGLNSEGKVYVVSSGSALDDIKGKNDINEWNEIVDIRASRNCIIGLTKKGAVLFFGKKEDQRSQVKEWHDIIAIAMDNVFAYGLSDKGQIYVAGICKKILDRGRSQSSQWKRIIKLSSNQSGIGAIDESGELQFAGTITGDIKIMKESWDKIFKDKTDLLYDSNI